MKKQKENSREGITWSEMGKQNVQAEKVYYETGLRQNKGFLREYSNSAYRICSRKGKRKGWT